MPRSLSPLVLLLLLLCSSFLWTGHAQEDPNLRHAINEANEAFSSKFGAADAAALADLFSANGDLMAPREPRIIGRFGQLRDIHSQTLLPPDSYGRENRFGMDENAWERS